MRSIIKEKKLDSKKILLRLDLNVPLESGKIIDTTRIDKILPTLNFLIEKKAKIIILSHVGRPKGKIVKELSLKPIVKNLEKKLIERFKDKGDIPIFKSLSERLEKLRDKAEQGLIDSIDFVKELCRLAKDTVQAEKELNNEYANSPKMALTDLFLELKTDETPIVIERIVNDIDQIVLAVRFDGWQDTSTGEREVKKALSLGLLETL